jgi:TM2 domain-containing membrane protein YozV
VVPGAGQAYNGQPIKGVFLFLTSVLVLPWLFALYDAHTKPTRLKAKKGTIKSIEWIVPLADLPTGPLRVDMVVGEETVWRTLIAVED